MARASLDLERSRFVDDLLSYMTLEEKLGQLELFHPADDPALEQAIAAGRIGGVTGACQPRRLQALAAERSRLGIPLMLTGPAIQQTLSPWALAATWDEDLARASGAAMARAAISGGFNCICAPLTGHASEPGGHGPHIAGDEPHLTARLAAAFACGADGAGDDGRGAVLAVAASDGEGSRGIAWALQAIHAGTPGALDCPALKRETAQRAGFAGLLVSECRRITQMIRQHYALTSARSGLESAERLIAEGAIGEHDVDMAVRGVLAAKHRLGLFRDPHRKLATPTAGPEFGRDAERVRASFVLLRNEAGLLPLSPVSDRVLVVGALEGAGGACADALSRAAIGHSIAPGLAQRQAGESWAVPVPGDHFALSLTCDAARRADFVLVVLEERHFSPVSEDEQWQRPSPATLALLRALALGPSRLVAIIATERPVDLADADQFFAAALQCWQPTAGFEEALSDVLSGRFSPQGRMPITAGRFVIGHGLGFGECLLSGFALATGETSVRANVRARNLGSFPMRETAQVYLRAPDGTARLIGFDHVMLAPGEECTMTFDLGEDALRSVSEDGRAEVVPGSYEILIGKSSLRLLSAWVAITPALARAMTLRERGFVRLAAG